MRRTLLASVGDCIAPHQKSWKRPKPTDYRREKCHGPLRIEVITSNRARQRTTNSWLVGWSQWVDATLSLNTPGIENKS